VLSRTLRVLSCSDPATKQRLDAREPVFILVAFHALQFVGAVLHRAQSAGLTLVNAKLAHLSAGDASRLSRGVDTDDGPCVAFELFSSAASGAAEQLRKALEPATFGYYALGQAAAADASFFFGVLPPASCVARGTALAVVKPHVVLARQAGQVLDSLVREFRITGITLGKLDRAQAASFLTVYDGVVPEHPLLLEELSAGPALVVECAPREDSDSRESIVQQLREVAGPADPELARLLRPHCLRAKWGIDKVRNGIHVTDLESDGELEAATMFQLAAQR
jgi:nucleoside-diphosphate kinase